MYSLFAFDVHLGGFCEHCEHKVDSERFFDFATAQRTSCTPGMQKFN